MHSSTVDFLISKSALTAIVLAAGLAWPLAQAQQVYRIVGPDGKVTFSDRAPLTASDARVSETAAKGTGGAGAAGLPFELRQAAQKYPVLLYTGNNCGTCDTARALLNNRGIPFNEKTITTQQDAEALKRLSGEAALPSLSIGSQQLKGFSDVEWTQFLNAAGYPARSVLPASYRPPAPTPLVAVAAAPAASASSAPKSATKSASVPAETPVTSPSPSGIRF
jgi:glutaredoxin